ncbi:bifunctional DNA primase/polymerase [Streptomyces sp. NPDC050560]|uniref:bifunctional DNA primase/polymerase n=1 Tax=Streptomyces sp. NPDC050560 TaxID=3365630 RepID=UPI00378FC27E
MGFTIGGIRELRGGPRRRGRTAGCMLVAEFSGLWGWDVAPGARMLDGVCSCGSASCPEPGAHPLDAAPVVHAGASLDEVADIWEDFPGAVAMLPSGGAFDVLEVGEAAGRRALTRLERMGLPLGPVAVTPGGRAQFFVAPGAAARLPDLLYRTGWDGTRLDLRGLGLGEHITAPPYDRGGRGPVRWLRSPAVACTLRPPEARLLLGTLAYVAHRMPLAAEQTPAAAV